MSLRFERQRDSSANLCAFGQKYYDGIDLAISLRVLLVEPPKGARPIPSPAAKKNPTSVNWAREHPRKKVGHQNINYVPGKLMIVAMPYGFSSIKLISVTATGAQFGPPGYECDLLYLACLAALVLGGSGPWAIDGLLRKNNVR